ncbi:hypothetical protein GY45DRAFT_1363932 [Cubamyces sp. BRFM 1775]|nr:hypothetical protein GY45DRAFT_1363932 [Cubamyces sp. BRFM 1775]
MRLLDTHTGQFVENQDPESIRYAILSHVWDKDGEQSYQDVLQIWKKAVRDRLLSTSGNPADPSTPTSILDSPELSTKVKDLCALARKHGHNFAWMDSCCIDKTSSAELTEAINSMYRYYRLADLCYAYLADVYDDPSTLPYRPSHKMLKRIKRTHWHTRGWTLQELVAPRRLVFLTRSWSIVDTRASLAYVLFQATGVDTCILTGDASLESISVARRMSWASKRTTTRVEDEAYSLMGIFGVYMPTIYGEGRDAFVRLQQEIIKTIPDQSIFAWGRQETVDIMRAGRTPEDRSALKGWMKDVFGGPNEHFESLMREASMSWFPVLPWSLLAASANDFAGASEVTTISDEDFVDRLGYTILPDELPELECTFAAEGARVHLVWYAMAVSHSPATEDADALVNEESSSCSDDHPQDILAILRCKDGQGRVLALHLSIRKRLRNSQPGSNAHHIRRKASGAWSVIHLNTSRIVALPLSRELQSRPEELRASMSRLRFHEPLLIYPVAPAAPVKPRNPDAALRWKYPTSNPDVSIHLQWLCKHRLKIAGISVTAFQCRSGQDQHMEAHFILCDHRAQVLHDGSTADESADTPGRIMTIHIIVRCYFGAMGDLSLARWLTEGGCHIEVIRALALDPEQRHATEMIPAQLAGESSGPFLKLEDYLMAKIAGPQMWEPGADSPPCVFGHSFRSQNPGSTPSRRYSVRLGSQFNFRSLVISVDAGRVNDHVHPTLWLDFRVSEEPRLTPSPSYPVLEIEALSLESGSEE